MPVKKPGKSGVELDSDASNSDSDADNFDDEDGHHSSRLAALAAARKRKGCKVIVNCEHKEEKHYAKVIIVIMLMTVLRECATSAIIRRVALS